MRFRLRSLACLALAACLSALIAPAIALAEVKASGAKPGGSTTAADKPTVAVFRLNGAVKEQPEDSGLSELFGAPPVSLKDVVQRLNKAADDPNVKAVVLFTESAAVGPAQVEE